MKRLLKPKVMYRYSRIRMHNTEKAIRAFLGDNFPFLPMALEKAAVKKNR